MRKSPVLGALILAIVACGSSGGPTAPSPPPASTTHAFSPPPPPAGYTRLTAVTVRAVPAGGDQTFCQYAMAPFDHDVDIVDVQGYQSTGGHHAAAFSYTDTGGQKLGTSVQCMGTEFTAGAKPSKSTANPLSSMGGYLGGVGGQSSRGKSFPLPAGVAFRLKKGDGIMLNVHYLNPGVEPIDGNSVLDVKFADTDPNRKIAAMFLNLDIGFTVAPDMRTDSTTNCVAQSDVQIILMGNHMHQYGTTASTEVLRAGTGAVEMLHRDPTWTYDMQFNPVYSNWPIETPFVLHAGDTLRTTCSWVNTTAKSMAFPAEMCIGTGFALATGSNPTAPMCINGMWLAKGL
jgi:hypothetical protein